MDPVLATPDNGAKPVSSTDGTPTRTSSQKSIRTFLGKVGGSLRAQRLSRSSTEEDVSPSPTRKSLGRRRSILGLFGSVRGRVSEDKRDDDEIPIDKPSPTPHDVDEASPISNSPIHVGRESIDALEARIERRLYELKTFTESNPPPSLGGPTSSEVRATLLSEPESQVYPESTVSRGVFASVGEDKKLSQEDKMPEEVTIPQCITPKRTKRVQWKAIVEECSETDELCHSSALKPESNSTELGSDHDPACSYNDATIKSIVKSMVSIMGKSDSCPLTAKAQEQNPNYNDKDTSGYVNHQALQAEEMAISEAIDIGHEAMEKARLKRVSRPSISDQKSQQIPVIIEDWCSDRTLEKSIRLRNPPEIDFEKIRARASELLALEKDRLRAKIKARLEGMVLAEDGLENETSHLHTDKASLTEEKAPDVRKIHLNSDVGKGVDRETMMGWFPDRVLEHTIPLRTSVKSTGADAGKNEKLFTKEEVHQSQCIRRAQPLGGCPRQNRMTKFYTLAKHISLKQEAMDQESHGRAVETCAPGPTLSTHRQGAESQPIPSDMHRDGPAILGLPSSANPRNGPTETMEIPRPDFYKKRADLDSDLKQEPSSFKEALAPTGPCFDDGSYFRSMQKPPSTTNTTDSWGSQGCRSNFLCAEDQSVEHDWDITLYKPSRRLMKLKDVERGVEETRARLASGGPTGYKTEIDSMDFIYGRRGSYSSDSFYANLSQDEVEQNRDIISMIVESPEKELESPPVFYGSHAEAEMDWIRREFNAPEGIKDSSEILVAQKSVEQFGSKSSDADRYPEGSRDSHVFSDAPVSESSHSSRTSLSSGVDEVSPGISDKQGFRFCQYGRAVREGEDDEISHEFTGRSRSRASHTGQIDSRNVGSVETNVCPGFFKFAQYCRGIQDSEDDELFEVPSNALSLSQSPTYDQQMDFEETLIQGTKEFGSAAGLVERRALPARDFESSFNVHQHSRRRVHGSDESEASLVFSDVTDTFHGPGETFERSKALRDMIAPTTTEIVAVSTARAHGKRAHCSEGSKPSYVGVLSRWSNETFEKSKALRDMLLHAPPNSTESSDAREGVVMFSKKLNESVLKKDFPLLAADMNIRIVGKRARKLESVDKDRQSAFSDIFQTRGPMPQGKKSISSPIQHNATQRASLLRKRSQTSSINTESSLDFGEPLRRVASHGDVRDSEAQNEVKEDTKYRYDVNVMNA